MSEPQYITNLRDEVRSMSLSDAFNTFVSNWSAWDNWDGAFTTRGYKIYNAALEELERKIAAAETENEQLKVRVDKLRESLEHVNGLASGEIDELASEADNYDWQHTTYARILEEAQFAIGFDKIATMKGRER